MVSARLNWIGCIAAALALAACGGGGGSDPGTGAAPPPPAPAPAPTPAPPPPAPPPPAPPPPAPATYSLSGTISVAETSVVDSDTNDALQADYARNNTAATAQRLPNPVVVVGSVNKANTGPRGRNNDGTAALSDVDDWYRIDLTAGQVVELEFANDATVADVDLYLYNSSGTVVGISDGFNSRFECVTVSTTGTYYVNVSAYLAASLYNLRIGAPGTGTTCAQRTQSAQFMPNQLVAEAKRGGASSLSKANAALASAGADVHMTAAAKTGGGGLVGDLGPELVQLPADAVQRARTLRKLKASTGSNDGNDTSAVANGSQPPDRDAALETALDTGAQAVELLKYAKHLRGTGAFEYVQLNWLQQTHTLVGNFPPNDRLYPYQRWHYEQINLPSAMQRLVALNLPATQQRPLVAVIDSGAVLDHPDITPQLFSVGRAFISTTAQGSGDVATGDDPGTVAQQPHFHGTHVAGTVLASTFDGVGGAGVAPMAYLLPLRVFPPGQGASIIDVAQAMRYAARLSNRSGLVPARRADVINMSLGAQSSCDPVYQTTVTDVRSAGTVVVVSSGNDGHNDQGARTNVGSPANCSGVIAVSATDAQKRITPYSNTGAAISVAAPGGDGSKSTTGTGEPDNVFSAVGSFDSTGRRIASFGGMQGTSMASPHVAGVIALMRFVNPALTVAQIDALLANGSLTDDLGPTGRDIDYGFGLINARKAVDAAAAALATPPPAATVQVVANPSQVDFGGLRTSAQVQLLAAGTTTEAVVGAPVVTRPTGVNAGAVSVVATTVDTRGLGTYTITIDRAAITSVGSYFASVQFNLNSGRSVTAQLSITKQATGGSSGNLGPMYVLLLDPGTRNVLHTVLATWANGQYTWTKTGFAQNTVSILAGSDLDNDDIICHRGEACGAYPLLPAGNDYASITLTGNRSDLNFQVAPVGGINAAAQAGGESPQGHAQRRSVLATPGAQTARAQRQPTRAVPAGQAQ